MKAVSRFVSIAVVATGLLCLHCSSNSSTQAGAEGFARSYLGACNNGSTMDCCADSVAAGAACGEDGASCWMPCEFSQGDQLWENYQMGCAGGIWGPDRGIFGCQPPSDAGLQE